MLVEIFSAGLQDPSRQAAGTEMAAPTMNGPPLWRRTLDNAASTNRSDKEACFRLWARGTDELVGVVGMEVVDRFVHGIVRVFIRAGVDSVKLTLVSREGEAGFKLELPMLQQYAEPLSQAFEGSARAAFAIWDSARDQTTKDLYKDWVSCAKASP